MYRVEALSIETGHWWNLSGDLATLEAAQKWLAYATDTPNRWRTVRIAHQGAAVAEWHRDNA